MKSSLVLVLSFGLAVVCRADAVRLHITGPDGKPVVGAQVRVLEVKPSSGEDLFNNTTNFQSDAAGDVALESKNSLSKVLGKEQSNYLLARVTAPGLAIAVADLKAGDNTLSLAKGQSYSGVVLDGDEKPIVGAKVALFQLAYKQYSPTNYLFGGQKLEAQTDAQGQWSLDNVPAIGILGFNVTAPHFQSESLNLDVSQPAPPLYLEKGATIKGRLLKPDGTPAGDVRFYDGSGGGSLKTNADGTFEVDGSVQEGMYLQVMGGDTNKLPFIVPLKKVEDLQPGEVRDIGDWKTVEGFHLRGMVVDEATKKPIEGVSVSAWGNGLNGYGQSDEAGRFDILVSSDMPSYSVNGAGYVSQNQGNIPSPRGGTADVGTIALKSGRKVKGTLKTANGEGVAGFITARHENGGMVSTQTDEDGNFELGGLTPGEYTLEFPELELVGNPKFKVGTEELAPLKLVVAGDAETTTPQTVTGRVLFGQQPVAGAKIRVQFSNSRGNSLQQTAVSSSSGIFTLTSPLTNRTPKILGVSRPGYSTGTGELKIENGVWRGDVLLQKQGTFLRGRVVDSAGKPVANAFVGLDKGRELPVSTDAQGEFALKDVSTAGITLLASDGPRIQSFKIDKEGDPVQIALPDAPPAIAKGALAEQLVPGAHADWEWAKQWNLPGDQDLDEILAKILTSSDSDLGWSGIIPTLAVTQPAQYLTHAKEIRSRVRGASKSDLDLWEMLAKAASTDAPTRAEVKSWLDAKEQEKRDLSPSSVYELLKLTEVAQKLDPKLGATWLDYAAQISSQLPQNGSETMWNWGQLAARISPQAGEALTEEWTPGAKLQFLASAMQTYRELGDVAKARQTFAQMEKLALEAQNKGETLKVYGQTRQPKETLGQGRDQLARTLFHSAPKEALEVAEQLDDYRKSSVLLLIAQSAVKQGDLDTARAALTSLLQLDANSSSFIAQGAKVAQGFDPALGDKIYAKAFRLALPKNQSFDDWSPSIADYIKARASQSAGASRILLEREWLQRIDVVKKQKDDSYSNSRRVMKDLAVAMATINPQRALEMTERIPDSKNMRFDARSKIDARGEIVLELLKNQ